MSSATRVAHVARSLRWAASSRARIALTIASSAGCASASEGSTRLAMRIQARRGDMPHFYRIRSTPSPVATDLDVVDVLVADRAGSMAYLAAGEQRLPADRDVIG